ncbi:PREDICTED: E3 ubiquitin-protein ligase siah-1-like [Nicrophorus vespilloides]|uniref:E3 ubiquitin-protein ligase n=1 Tax=Nicrophorus vespilloides TaxID=110193 RepID=A0ABM1MYI8_NICVS|nr:PREDICTED: E3 ubiquitin-protein ligase siah-1-like [Nicrophorus vespilloides]
MLDMELNKLLLNRVECPACLDYMVLKIYVCKTGHSVCQNCYGSLRECPVCRTELTRTRNYDLESIAELLSYPCTNEGCPEFIPVPKTKSHMLKCKYQLVNCVLGKCVWKGFKTDLKNHALAAHENLAWMQEESLDRWRFEIDEKSEVQLIRAFDEIFYIHRHYIGNNEPCRSIMYWVVQYIGNPEMATKFGYTIRIVGEDCSNFPEISMNQICVDDTVTFMDSLNNGKCIGVPVALMKTFRNKYNSVWFKVSIKELK